MSELLFYTNPQSRGRIVHWMLEETGADYQTIWMDFGPKMKDTAYLAVNPMGKVPALKHGEVVVTEAPAICAYLADLSPEKNLAPPVGNPARGIYYRWLFFAAGPLEAAATAKSMGWQVPPGKSGFIGFGCYEDTINAVEKALSNGPYLCGEQFTAADVYVGSALGWGMMSGSIEKRRAFEAYVGRLYARPAPQRANAINEEYLKQSRQQA
ncbi:glutathione S-transferase family protein [Noviherbaspirillum denitrificans]|uniref:Glutathione S-transferase n=1 Tax=Noviherbaspirillum denitrificans TaxID=1968433 RepID=A0A254TEU5_9BURK|nr:glutathione S-transferase family protein [Noviherbaspirillum denitrificans]OWW21124.1 glutathione S-transferase [Noviherbaspirillum denitrificans]